MPKKKAGSSSRKIDSYQHDDKDRVNNPPVGLVTPDTDKDTGRKTYSYDPHLDPQLVWAGKAEHTSFDVPTVSLHVHERIDPCMIIETVRKKRVPQQRQRSLFELLEENPPMREAIEFYKHRHNWSNFCHGAIDYAASIENNIVPIDGDELAGLMIDYGVGSAPQTFTK